MASIFGRLRKASTSPGITPAATPPRPASIANGQEENANNTVTETLVPDNQPSPAASPPGTPSPIPEAPSDEKSNEKKGDAQNPPKSDEKRHAPSKPLDPLLSISLRVSFLSLLISGRPSSSDDPLAFGTPLTTRSMAHMHGSQSAADRTPGSGDKDRSRKRLNGVDGESEDVSSLTGRTMDIEKRFKETIEMLRDSSVRRFAEGYTLNAPLLQLPSTAATSPPSESMLGAQTKTSLILESEHDIRTLEQGLRELETLDARGVVGGGRLGDHAALVPTVRTLSNERIPQIKTSYNDLEARVGKLLARYNEYVDILSELFVEWNTMIEEAEEEISNMERERRREQEGF